MDILRVAQRLARALDPKKTRHLPGHVIYRVAALVGDDEVAYAEDSLAGDAFDRGEVVVITSSRVVYAAVEPGPGALPRVTVDTWPRRAIERIGLPPLETTDQLWDSPDGGHLPVGVQFVAAYGSRELTLPLSSLTDRATATSLLAGLLEDLGTRKKSFLEQMKE